MPATISTPGPSCESCKALREQLHRHEQAQQPSSSENVIPQSDATHDREQHQQTRGSGKTASPSDATHHCENVQQTKSSGNMLPEPKAGPEEVRVFIATILCAKRGLSQDQAELVASKWTLGPGYALRSWPPQVFFDLFGRVDGAKIFCETHLQMLLEERYGFFMTYEEGRNILGLVTLDAVLLFAGIFGETDSLYWMLVAFCLLVTIVVSMTTYINVEFRTPAELHRLCEKKAKKLLRES